MNKAPKAVCTYIIWIKKLWHAHINMYSTPPPPKEEPRAPAFLFATQPPPSTSHEQVSFLSGRWESKGTYHIITIITIVQHGFAAHLRGIKHPANLAVFAHYVHNLE